MILAVRGLHKIDYVDHNALQKQGTTISWHTPLMYGYSASLYELVHKNNTRTYILYLETTVHIFYKVSFLSSFLLYCTC